MKTPMGITLMVVSLSAWLVFLLSGIVLRTSILEIDGTTLDCGSVLDSRLDEFSDLGRFECRQAGLDRNKTIMFISIAVGLSALVGILLLPRGRTCPRCGRRLGAAEQCACTTVPSSTPPRSRLPETRGRPVQPPPVNSQLLADVQRAISQEPETSRFRKSLEMLCQSTVIVRPPTEWLLADGPDSLYARVDGLDFLCRPGHADRVTVREFAASTTDDGTVVELRVVTDDGTRILSNPRPQERLAALLARQKIEPTVLQNSSNMVPRGTNAEGDHEEEEQEGPASALEAATRAFLAGEISAELLGQIERAVRGDSRAHPS